MMDDDPRAAQSDPPSKRESLSSSELDAARSQAREAERASIEAWNRWIDENGIPFQDISVW